jgi:selenide,water dikinase
LTLASHPNVLRSIDRLDDAGVYKISEEIAFIQTVDFITPIVNDPYNFGQIAAANSISDVYTMGGKPITAMNIVCFPRDSMDISILREVLRESDKMQLGGFTVVIPDRSRMKYSQ